MEETRQSVSKDTDALVLFATISDQFAFVLHALLNTACIPLPLFTSSTVQLEGARTCQTACAGSDRQNSRPWLESMAVHTRQVSLRCTPAS
jgi:hypothetical protein